MFVWSVLYLKRKDCSYCSSPPLCGSPDERLFLEYGTWYTISNQIWLPSLYVNTFVWQKGWSHKRGKLLLSMIAGYRVAVTSTRNTSCWKGAGSTQSFIHRLSGFSDQVSAGLDVPLIYQYCIIADRTSRLLAICFTFVFTLILTGVCSKMNGTGHLLTSWLNTRFWRPLYSQPYPRPRKLPKWLTTRNKNYNVSTLLLKYKPFFWLSWQQTLQII